MGTVSGQETWMPFESTQDCSQGFCSIFCPQWCHLFLPPPPPFFSDEDQTSSGPSFSPLVIAIIGVLSSVFLLVAYYTVTAKYCGGFDALRRRFLRSSSNRDEELEDDATGASQHYETWHVLPSNGLDEALINKIAVYRYKRGEGLVDGTDCSVCLSEFREDESLRLLPKCSHAFHLQCIDTWLKSHSNCPLCRANIISVTPGPLPLSAPPEAPETNPFTTAENQQHSDDEMVVVVPQESNRREEEEQEPGNDGAEAKDTSMVHRDRERDGHSVLYIEDGGMQSIRRSFSMDSSLRGRVSIISHVLRLSMEDEFLAAKEPGSLKRAEYWRQCAAEHYYKGSSRSRGLQCVMSSMPMKRSFSSGRFCFARHGKGETSALPL